MSEKKIKGSIDAIEPKIGAKERMYQNIMKKAQQAAPAEKPAEPQKKVIPFVRYKRKAISFFFMLYIISIY